ncbi:hypothetical protein NMG29_35055 [Streptomyces cocklensis]|uniref:hypothetical protein n=1 Tax=Actinacidiphila cocklensis TaxID=887465 RepID=UPI002041FDC1|nr:hypothetical protein [Actinacidiphila cocklensis]MDD1063333.1 hypothetical protein [Actinacidiphila cocklensis]
MPGAGPARLWGLVVVGVPLLVIMLIGLAAGPSGSSGSAAPDGGGFGSGTSAGGTSLGAALLPSWTPQNGPEPSTTAPAVTPFLPDTTAPTDTYTDTYTDPATGTATPQDQATETGTGEPTAFTGAQAVVAAYFDAINNRDYQAAWNLGGSNFADDYDQFVAGFATTDSDAVTFVSVQQDVVRVYFQAWQKDGTADSYNATFTVSGGRITGGKVTPTT